MNAEAIWIICIVLGVIMVWAVSTARSRYLKAETLADFDTAWHAAEELARSGIKLSYSYSEEARQYKSSYKYNTVHIGDNVVTVRDMVGECDAYVDAMLSLLMHCPDDVGTKRRINLVLLLTDRGNSSEIIVNNESVGYVEISINTELLPPSILVDIIKYIL